MADADRRRKLSKSMDTLFPHREIIHCRCTDCEWSTETTSTTIAFEHAKGCPDCDSGTRVYTTTDDESCRVCAEPVVDGRWNYCSERCREIASAVQGMFVWTLVREKILERDDYTCQECGTRREGLEVDHIERLADGGHPFDESNLQTLCESCHSEKTAEENSIGDTAPELTLADYLES